MKRLLSGITPSGDGSLHIGNYLGAVKQFIELARDHETFLMVADLHALTTIQNKSTLIKNIETLVLNELALLGELPNLVFFRQSDVPMHTELQSILNNVTPLGLLKRAHAYKDKLAKDVMEDDINVGLFSYPMLMAADILIYKPELVPVGKDQKQHVEITRDVAGRFNKAFATSTFVLPEPYIPEEVATVLGVDGQRKMSKSIGNIISIFAPEEVIRKQVNSCFTDPTRKKATDPGHIAGNMVFTYLSHFGNPEKVTELASLYTQGKIGDVECKEYLCHQLLETFKEARERYAELSSDKTKVTNILKRGAEKATAIATKTMEEVRKAIGITTTYSFFTYPKQVDASSAITIDQFASVRMQVGKVLQATHPEKSEKLIRLEVDFGTETRIIFTAVRPYGYTKDDFIGKQFFFVTNLAPRKMIGEESQGMILAVDGPEHKPIFVSGADMPVGSVIH